MSPGGWALKHPVPVAVITAGAVLLGFLALFSLNREFVPPMVMPAAAVVTLWPGVGAEDVERELTSVLEDGFATVPGLTDLSSESREGVSIIQLQFTEDTDIDSAMQEVRSRVDAAAPDLPDELPADPAVSSWGSGDLPVLSFSVSGPGDSDRVARYVDDVVIPELYKVSGVARTRVLGARRRELRIRLNTGALGASNVTPLEVYGALDSRNVVLPAGLVDLDGGRWAFRVSGEFSTVDELLSLVVGRLGNRPVRLGDVAEIDEVYQEASEVVRSGGNDVVAVQVTKRESGNALDMTAEIRRRLRSLEESGAGYAFTVLHDDSRTIGLSLGTVMNSAITGIIMAVAVIWLFLRNIGSTLVAAVSLPVSLVLTFAGMRLAGLSVNVLTMAGMTASLGMVVDASIVVLESIHQRWAAGDSLETAALAGSSSVSAAVVASTTTSVGVFAPMLFLGGLIGIILKDLSLTLVLCLSSSLAAALFLVPPLALRVLRRNSMNQSPDRPLKHTPLLLTHLEHLYRRLLNQALGIGGSVVFAALCILAVSMLAADMIGISFLPSADYGEIFVSLELPPGSSLNESLDSADRTEVLIRDAVPEVSGITAYVGLEDDLAGEERRRESVWMQVLLQSRGRTGRAATEIVTELGEVLPGHLPGTAVTVFNGGFDRMLAMGTDGSGYRVELVSESWESLRSAADTVEAFLARDPDVISTNRDVNENRRRVTAVLDGDALGELGVPAARAAMAARIAFEGVDAGSYRPQDGPDRTLRLVSDLDGRSPGSSSLAYLPLRGAEGRILPFESVSSVKEGRGLSGIRRRDRARILTVVAYTRDENVRGVSRRLREHLDANPLPNGVDWSVQGVGGLIIESAGALGLFLAVSLFLVYAVMAIQFERLLQPLVIMASVPFCFIGVVGGLALFGSDISLTAFMGVVALAGIVVNNAIVQVDRINQLRAGGMDLDEAILLGSSSRLRPILMTTLTTFFGVLPLSLARGTGAGIYAPLGQAIAGGLLSSTLVTLFLVPVLYGMLERRRS